MRIPALVAAGLIFVAAIPRQPSATPPPAVTVPCVVSAVHDGDTLTADITLRVQVRLLDCWAPELNEPGGPEAKARMRELATGEAVLEIPLQGARRLDDALTFGRVLGRVWVGDQDVGAVLMQEKLATKTKQRKTT